MQHLSLSASEHLELFLSEFNHLVADHNAALEENEQLRLALSNADTAIETAKALDQQLTAIKKELELTINGSNKTAGIAAAQVIELAKLREQLAAQQKEITRYKALGVDRLTEQNKRLKDTNTELTAKNNRLTHEKSQGEHAFNRLKAEYAKLEDENLQLGRQLSHNQGTGIYHNGPHHLIVWPQLLKVEDPSGEQFKCRALLYMHSSGRGGLMTYSESQGTTLCAGPAGGLKPSTAVIEFAQNWLYKVNELQKGEVTHADMMAVDYNPSAATE